MLFVDDEIVETNDYQLFRRKLRRGRILSLVSILLFLPMSGIAIYLGEHQFPWLMDGPSLGIILGGYVLWLWGFNAYMGLQSCPRCKKRFFWWLISERRCQNCGLEA